MNIRYLYGKEKILGPVIRDEAPIRLCDLTHYSRMENEKCAIMKWKKFSLRIVIKLL